MSEDDLGAIHDLLARLGSEVVLQPHDLIDDPAFELLLLVIAGIRGECT